MVSFIDTLQSIGGDTHETKMYVVLNQKRLASFFYYVITYRNYLLLLYCSN